MSTARERMKAKLAGGAVPAPSAAVSSLSPGAADTVTNAIPTVNGRPASVAQAAIAAAPPLPAFTPPAPRESSATVSRGTVAPTAAVSEATRTDQPVSWKDMAERYVKKKAQELQSMQAERDLQRLASPLETTMGALTASSRGIAETANQAMHGRNPLWYEDAAGPHQPFYEGAQDSRKGWRHTLDQHLPEFSIDTPAIPLPFGQQLPPLHIGRDAAITAAGTGLDIVFDPMLASGVGGVTNAGKNYRAAELGRDAARMELGAALDYPEARAATDRIHRSMDQLSELRPQLEAEGTLPSRGRAALTFAGRTNPVLAQGKAVATAQRVVQKVGATRVVRGLSHLVQPAQERVPEEVKGRYFIAMAKAGVGRREAMRALSDLIDRHPQVFKEMGGDVRAFDDALSLALEHSVAPQFDNAIDHLTVAERAKYFEGDAGARERWVLVGRERARANLPRFLSRAEHSSLRESEAVQQRNAALTEQLSTPVEYSDQLAQKELSARERSELQRLVERRARRENSFLRPANEPQGVGVAGPVEPVPGVTPRVVDRTEQYAARVHATKSQLQKLEDEMYSRNQRGLELGDRTERRAALQERLTEQELSLSRERQRLSEVVPGTPGIPAADAPAIPGQNPWTPTGVLYADRASAKLDLADILTQPGKGSARIVERNGGFEIEIPTGSRPKPSGALANPNDERRISELQDLAVARAEKARAKSLAKARDGAQTAAQRVRALTVRAQSRADMQALDNSITTARRMFYRGASPEAARVFGDYARDLIPRLNARNAAMFTNTAREGVQLAELTDVQAYMMHATTPEAQEAMLEAAVERGEIQRGTTFREWSEKHAPQQTRKMRMTAVEANDLARQGKLGITGGRKVDQFFYTNPLIAQLYREQAGSAAQGYARFAREAAATYGRPVKLAPKGWRTVPNDIAGIGDQIAFEPEVADLLTRHYWALRDPWKITAAYDRMNQIWKTYTLGIYPNYHVRNEVSDLWNAHVLGGMDLKWVAPAMDELIGETEIARRIGRPKGSKTYTSKTGEQFVPGALRDEAESNGIIESSQWQQDIEQHVLRDLADTDGGGLPGAPAVRRVSRAVREAGAGETGARAVGSKVGAGLNAAQRQLTDNRAVAAATAIGNMREQAFRLALYMDRRMAGWSAEASAIWVRKHLIDYSQMSNFEKEGIKRVLPFYTFTRHNVPLQLEYLFAKPGAFSAVEHVRENAGGDEGMGMGQTPLPSFLNQGVPLRTGTSENGDPEFWRLEGMWPGADAMLPFSGDKMAQKGLSMVSPFIQEPIEQGTNIDWFKSMPGKPVQIEDYPGEEDSFLGVSIPNRWTHVLENMRPLGELNRLNPGNVFGTSTTPSAMGAVRKYPDLDQSQRWLNLALGRGYAINPAKNQYDHQRALEHAVRVLENEIATAERDGKTRKAEQARRQLEYLYAHPESITPDMAK